MVKQELLEIDDVKERIKKVSALITSEIEVSDSTIYILQEIKKNNSDIEKQSSTQAFMNKTN